MNDELKTYYVFYRNTRDNTRSRSEKVKAKDFGDAEKKGLEYIYHDSEYIDRIDWDW